MDPRREHDLDGLTGLATRAHLVEAAEEAACHAAVSGRPIALLFIDLNGFKRVNDTLGHVVGPRAWDRPQQTRARAD
jgi:diguanylate cyclase (GGDEF)-like protein